MVKWIIISPPAAAGLLFYLLRDLAMLLKHQDLLRGLTIFILVSLLGIFFTARLQRARREERVRRRLGEETYEWIEGLQDCPAKRDQPLAEKIGKRYGCMKEA